MRHIKIGHWPILMRSHGRRFEPATQWERLHGFAMTARELRASHDREMGSCALSRGRVRLFAEGF